MKFEIKCHVNQEFQKINKQLTRDFLLLVNPKTPPFKITRFDGENKGDQIHLELNFILFKEKWEYEIVKNHLDDLEWTFIDKSVKHPFFLKYWCHQFRMQKVANGIKISDEVIYKSPFYILDFILYPILFINFNYRKAVYKKIYSPKEF